MEPSHSEAWGKCVEETGDSVVAEECDGCTVRANPGKAGGATKGGELGIVEEKRLLIPACPKIQKALVGRGGRRKLSNIK